jgi:hypothetical protein
MKKMWYVYTMEFYSAIKNETLPFAGKWIELKSIIFSQVQKVRGHMFSLKCGI